MSGPALDRCRRRARLPDPLAYLTLMDNRPVKAAAILAVAIVCGVALWVHLFPDRNAARSSLALGVAAVLVAFLRWFRR